MQYNLSWYFFLYENLLADILREFNPRLLGVSHGMGTREQLPEHQLNVAQADAKTDNLPDQVGQFGLFSMKFLNN